MRIHLSEDGSRVHLLILVTDQQFQLAQKYPNTRQALASKLANDAFNAALQYFNGAGGEIAVGDAGIVDTGVMGNVQFEAVETPYGASVGVEPDSLPVSRPGDGFGEVTKAPAPPPEVMEKLQKAKEGRPVERVKSAIPKEDLGLSAVPADPAQRMSTRPKANLSPSVLSRVRTLEADQP
jgi:hypothetical protein